MYAPKIRFLLQTGYHRWVDNNPLVYSEWYSYTQEQQVSEKIWSTLLGKQKQPLLDVSSPCTLMVPLPYSNTTNWAKVPCDYQPHISIGVGYICKTPRVDAKKDIEEKWPNSINVVNGHDTLTLPMMKCPIGWVHLDNECFHVDSGVLQNWSNSHATCTENGGTLLPYNVSKSMTQSHVDTFSWPQLFWVGKDTDVNQSGRDKSCPAVYRMGFQNHWTHNEVQINCSRLLPSLCLIKSVNIEQKCQSQQYECSDGTCISTGSLCDGVSDCFSGDDEASYRCDGLSFTCSNGQHILLSHYCDYSHDCVDGSDERCFYPECGFGEFKCDNHRCISQELRCNFHKDCMDGSDETETTCEWRTRCKALGGFLCFSGKCLPQVFVNDNVQDCPGHFQEDEMEPSTYNGTRMLVNSCSDERNKYHCDTSGLECTSEVHKCVYDYDQRGVVIGCGNFAHIHNCRLFECPSMFKCPGTYCIPTNRVCDGSWDCPNGWDEKFCSNFSCPSLFRCKGEKSCLDQRYVCDGVVHCKHNGDDEQFCDLLVCPRGCFCTGYVVNCSFSNMTHMPNVTKQVRALILKNNVIQIVPSMLHGFLWLGLLDLSTNQIGHFPGLLFKDQINLYHLNLADNHIRILDRFSFWGLSHLQTLELSGNSLQGINAEAFMGLSVLTFLDLSNFRVQVLQHNSFKGLANLKSLILENNRIHLLENGAFLGLGNLSALNLEKNHIAKMPLDSFNTLHNLRSLRTDAFKFCCIVPQVSICLPASDEFSSCSDLMANPVLQVSIWVLGVAATLGNIFVIVWRCYHGDGKVPSILVLNLAVSDFVMGVYMLIIASADSLYRGNYIMHDTTWRASIGCKIAGFLSALSSEVSVSTLLVITIDRSIAIIFPYQSLRWRFGAKGIKITCLVIWLVWLMLCSVPLFGINYFGDFYGNNGVCLPFTLSSIRDNGWEFSSAVFIAFNLLTFLAIAIGYMAIFYSVRMSQKNTNAPRDQIETRLAIRSTFIVFTDFVCWMPVVLLAILALYGVHIPSEVSAWVAVFVLPLNSAINPILYTMTTRACRPKHPKKKGQRSSLGAGTNSTSRL